ncbi:MAG TPA: guanylate kinase [Ruminococcaceae bacterium]|jgi:guanylate kinase|nr:guanylate kinase [Oscillospiraceae bacterium]
MSDKGLLVVFSGPSGAGKDTILKEFFSRRPNARLSISATTRQPRPGEKDGEDYFFLTKEKFESIAGQGGMLEYAQYCGNYYGTPARPIETWLAEGKDVILEIEVQGGQQIREKCPDCVSIFMLPPSLEVLEKRLRGRHTDGEEVIKKRLKAACGEIMQAENYDYVIVNDTIAGAVEQINLIIAAEKLRFSRARSVIERMLNHAETIC